MSGLRCPDCGRFINEDGGLHECPGPAICRCGHESFHHLTVSAGKGYRYDRCTSPFNTVGEATLCDCKRFRS